MEQVEAELRSLLFEASVEGLGQHQVHALLERLEKVNLASIPDGPEKEKLVALFTQVERKIMHRSRPPPVPLRKTAGARLQDSATHIPPVSLAAVRPASSAEIQVRGHRSESTPVPRTPPVPRSPREKVSSDDQQQGGWKKTALGMLRLPFLSPRADSTESQAGGGISPRRHAFTLVSAFTPIHCSFCKRVRTTTSCYLCASCGYTVHKHCLPLVPPACIIMDNTRATEVPVTFQAMENKFRCLQPVNMKRIRCDGMLWKQSRKGKWRFRYFVLPSDSNSHHIFYFANKPTESNGSEFCIPQGGLPLWSARVQATTSFERPYCMSISGGELDRAILLCADSEEDRNRWLKATAIQVDEFDRQKREREARYDWNNVATVENFPICVVNTVDILSEMYSPYRATLFEKRTCINAELCDAIEYRVHVEGVRNVPAHDGGSAVYFVAARAYHSGKLITMDQYTVPLGSCQWNEVLILADSVSKLPVETVIMFSLYKLASAPKKAAVKDVFWRVLQGVFGSEDESITTCIGHAHVTLCDAFGRIKTGKQQVFLWPGEGTALHFSFNEDADLSWPMLSLVLPEPPMPVVYPSFPWQLLDRSQSLPQIRQETVVDILARNEELQHNPLEAFPEDQMQYYWESRDRVSSKDLHVSLQACNWLDPKQREQVNILCQRQMLWESMSVSTALHLLGTFSCTTVRMHAMAVICAAATDSVLYRDLALILLFAIRFEPHDWTPAIEVLVNRLIQSKAREVIHAFFWACYGQTGKNVQLATRFKCVLTVMMRFTQVADADLLRSRDALFVERLCGVARDEKRRVSVLRLLTNAKVEEFCLPTSVSHKVKKVNLEKSKALGSSAGPIFLSFTPSHANVPDMICKSGDDIRQDELIMLIGSLMNKVWENEGIDARLCLYRCVSTGKKVGWIEVVPGCTSLAKIQGYTVSGALRKSSITEWFQANSAPHLTKEKILNNFVSSLAAACVFEYVLGIGDRHCDNILLTTQGHIFHIDFGLILGKDYGIAATVPFTLTYQMVDFMGGKESASFRRFVDVATAAFLACRRHHSLLTALCMVAVFSGMPHCSKLEDVRHLRDALSPKIPSEEAGEMFQQLINTVLGTKAALINDALHNYYMTHYAAKHYK